jgi:nicotinamidase-related amidase
MPLTFLDENAALIVVDLQKGVVAIPCAHPMDEVVARAGALAQAFRRHGLPVVLVNVAGKPAGRTDRPGGLGDLPPDWTDLLAELDRQPGDHVVTKQTSGAFTGTDLEAYLKGRGVTQVVIVGVATSNGVEATARHAYALGFNVALAVDAMTDRSLDAHHNSLALVFPKIAETGATQDVLALLETRA